MKNIYFGIVAVVATFLIIFSCTKKDYNSSANSGEISSIKNWLHTNGGIYKNETMQVLAPNGSNLVGHLDWENAQQYTWNGRNYTDIPFVFDSYGTTIPGKDSTIAPASFNLVIRPNRTGSYEGALRTTMHGAKTENLNTSGYSSKVVQAYTLINGAEANVWQSNAESGNISAATRVHLTPVQVAEIRNSKRPFSRSLPNSKGGGNGKIMMAQQTTQQCITFGYNIYTYASDGGWGGGEMVIGTTTVYTTVCFDVAVDGSDGGDNTGGIKGGGGIPPTGDPDSYPPNVPPDPCARAKDAAKKANEMAKSEYVANQIANYKNSVGTDVNERAFSIVKNNFDGTTSYAAQGLVEGKAGDNVPIITNYPNITIVAGFHTHTSADFGSPSAGDVYALLEGFKGNRQFKTLYTLGPDKTLYAYVITDTTAALNFLNSYPKADNLGWDHNWKSSSSIWETFWDAKAFYYNDGVVSSDDMMLNANAYTIEQIKAGITVIKADSNGDLQPVNVARSGTTYNATDCPPQ